jgi:hypothetical protein
MTIRVVSIISRMNVGGPAILLAELVGGLPKTEFDHTLITGRCEKNEIDYLDSHQLDSDIIYLDKVQRSLLPLSDIRSFFDLVNLIKKLDYLKVFVTNSDKKADDMKAVSDKYIKTASLEELMRVNEKGKSVKIYVRSGATDSQIKELLMFIQGSGKEETVLMSLVGNFDLDELSVLTDKMKLPGGDDLKKASKDKK